MQSGTLKRILSGSTAGWCNIFLGLLAQIITVPIYLVKWGADVYGQWLALTSFFFFIQLIDTAHQTFIGYEVLRFGRSKLEMLERTLFSGIVIGIIIGISQVLLFVFLFYFTGFESFCIAKFSFDKQFVNDLKILIIAYSIMWAIFGSVGGILVRGLSAFGYYPRMAWWSVYINLISVVIPAFAVLLGLSFYQVGIILILVTSLGNIQLGFDYYKLYKNLQLNPNSFSFKLGFSNFKLSILVVFKNLADALRIQGVRIFLAPLAGVSNLAAFSTMRTGANVAMQGLHTLTNPLMPELMRFLQNKDQERSEAAFGTVWIMVVGILAPSLVIIQTFIGKLFLVWTKNQILFDPWLFGVLSLSVLIYSIAQPALAIVSGNNIIKPQLVVSSLMGAFVIIGIIILVPLFGILGAGFALLIAEITGLLGYSYFAKKWLSENGLYWPKQSSNRATLSVIISSIGITAIILFPVVKWITLSCCIASLIWNFCRYLNTLPEFATRKIYSFIPFLEKIYSIKI
ncbi:lipopolysaccharide biosynthesis protein [Flavisolibacter ginsengisoli]|jgi:O-antigen/teichoic acid export membrane protein|uniref:Membrane protein involved in the export of O-antigen and teichoic acid n=1 Tax=Flavisolibacter ginsengisoli DSM 18119 TaxID=1121884 RepID=A0A1M5E1V3_9BACT|nr:hypothetical protein [Flavisolibacter ginsengisoli]SHF73150.1 Membrane protein involved in the export of O-antigen and teichoic acid [Flavisolibacter ginsengisoli DSM 18119]